MSTGSDDTPATKQTLGAAAEQKSVTAGELAAQAQVQIERYEVFGDLQSLEAGRDLFHQLARELGPQPFDPPVAGLAEAYLLRYFATGNLRDLAEAYGLTLPCRHTKNRPRSQAIYVHARAANLLYRRTGSVPLLDLAIEGLEQLNAPGDPTILKCAAAYAEALLDRYRLLPAHETLRAARDIVWTAIQDAPPLSLPGAAACRLAFGRVNYEFALAATRTDETYDGAPVIITDLQGVALAAVNTLRGTVNSLSEDSPILPLALSQLADALVLLSRFKESQDYRSGLRQEAVSAARTAAAKIGPRSLHASAIYRTLANALRWHSPGDPVIVESLETAAKVGAESDLAEGLAAALDWGAIEPLRASVYVEAILHRLQTQLEADGKFRMDLLQDYTKWIVRNDGGKGELVRWHGLRWVKDAAAWPVRMAAAWVSAGQAGSAILTIEKRPILALDCGRSGDLHPPGWSELQKAAETCPIVYLTAGEDKGYALILDATRNPVASAIPLPGFTTAAIGLRLHGEAYEDPDIEGLEYAMGYIGGNLAKGGLIQNYASWQARNQGLNNNDFWFQPLDDCGKWLGEAVLQPIEKALSTRELVLIPTGQISLLPLAAAWVPDAVRPSGRRYLTDSFIVRYSPSVRVLLRNSHEAAEATFTGIAVPCSNNVPKLAFADTEIRIAASNFTRQNILSGAQATAANATSALSHGSVLHLACHATSHFSEPFSSNVSLAGDDRLYLWQLANIDLSRTDLVILSSCESGVVSRQATDQPVSLASVLLGAGARAVIATTWSISDVSTAILMLRFYFAWRIEKQTPAAALQTAQCWLRDTANSEKARFCEGLLPELGGRAVFDVDAVSSIYRFLAVVDADERKYAHPHYWAAFSYFGQ
jgi:CHAT domain-containing protein